MVEFADQVLVARSELAGIDAPVKATHTELPDHRLAVRRVDRVSVMSCAVRVAISQTIAFLSEGRFSWDVCL